MKKVGSYIRIETLFQIPSREFEVTMTYLEVYNEKLMDLIASSSSGSSVEPSYEERRDERARVVKITDGGNGMMLYIYIYYFMTYFIHEHIHLSQFIEFYCSFNLSVTHLHLIDSNIRIIVQSSVTITSHHPF